MQGSFPKKEVWEPNSGGSRISKRGDVRGSRRRRRWGGGMWGGVSRCPPPQWRGVWRGSCAPPQKKNRFWISNSRTLVQTRCFLYSSPKAGLNAGPTFKITLGTPFPGVPAGNDPWLDDTSTIKRRFGCLRPRNNSLKYMTFLWPWV